MRLALLVVALLFIGCGEYYGYDDDYYDPYDDSDRSCGESCDSLCESCYSSPLEESNCYYYCEPKCNMYGCDYNQWSTTCEEMFNDACSLY